MAILFQLLAETRDEAALERFLEHLKKLSFTFLSGGVAIQRGDKFEVMCPPDFPDAFAI